MHLHRPCFSSPLRRRKAVEMVFLLFLALVALSDAVIVLKADKARKGPPAADGSAATLSAAAVDARTGEAISGVADTPQPAELPPLATYPPSSPKAGQPIQPIFEAEVDSPEIVEAAKWAVDYLSKMSDSGVYESLRLHRILWAATHSGVFHSNTILKLQLASPDIESDSKDEATGGRLSTHEVVVMADLENPSSRSFSIDDFPPMKEAAIERKWRENAWNHARKREEAFKRLEEEAAAAAAAAAAPQSAQTEGLS